MQENNQIEQSLKTLKDRVEYESRFFDNHEAAILYHLKLAHAHLFEETEGRDVDSLLTDIRNIIDRVEKFSNR